MKIISIAILATLISCASLAQQQQPQATSLKGGMKAMSSALKTIAAQVSDATKNPASEKLATDLLAATEDAKKFIPDTASTADQKQQYIKMMDDTIAIERELVAAFHNNDNVKATDMLTKLSASKKDGHAAFK